MNTACSQMDETEETRLWEKFSPDCGTGAYEELVDHSDILRDVSKVRSRSCAGLLQHCDRRNARRPGSTPRQFVIRELLPYIVCSRDTPSGPVRPSRKEDAVVGERREQSTVPSLAVKLVREWRLFVRSVGWRLAVEQALPSALR